MTYHSSDLAARTPLLGFSDFAWRGEIFGESVASDHNEILTAISLHFTPPEAEPSPSFLGRLPGKEVPASPCFEDASPTHVNREVPRRTARSVSFREDRRLYETSPLRTKTPFPLSYGLFGTDASLRHTIGGSSGSSLH